MPKDREAQLKAMLNVPFLDHVQAINKFTADDRWFCAIGRFIFEFSQLEYLLKYYVAVTIGLRDQHFAAITSQFDFARLCAAAQNVWLQPHIGPSIQDVLGERPAHLRKRTRKRKRIMAGADERERMLKKLLNECKLRNEDRVRVVHGLWSISGAVGVRELNYVSKHTFNNSTYFRDPDELAKKADQAAYLRHEIEKWWGWL
jgi:hypothetical protein